SDLRADKSNNDAVCLGQRRTLRGHSACWDVFDGKLGRVNVPPRHSAAQAQGALSQRALRGRGHPCRAGRTGDREARPSRMARGWRALLAPPDRPPRERLVRAPRRRSLEALRPLRLRVLHRRRRVRRAPDFRVRGPLDPRLVFPRERTALAHHDRRAGGLGGGMLKLLFKAFDNRGGVEVSAYAFTLHRGNLEAWPEGRLVARHVENQWAVDGRTFLRFECGPNVACLFESADSVAEHYGPFDSLSCVDGVVWAESDAIATLKS